MAGYEPIPDADEDQDSCRRRRMSRRLRLPIALLLLLVVFLILVTPGGRWPRRRHSSPSDAEDGEKKLVPLEIHVMSKCPDAKDCLKDLILPAMEKISPQVNFTLSFIGKYATHAPFPLGSKMAKKGHISTDDDGVSCMHGETECLGNMIELCATMLYTDPKIYLGFAMCLSNQYDKIPQEDFVEECALEHGVNFGKLNGCMSRDDGQSALDMLRTSFDHTKDVGVTKSCTVRLDNKIRCIRDGGQWKDCDGGSSPEDLIRDVNALYDA